MTDHKHQWAITGVDDAAGSRGARKVTVACTLEGCAQSVTRITARTDVELQAELDEANA